MDDRSITDIVSDICKFTLDQCCEVRGEFFNAESELGMEEKFAALHHYRTSSLNINDYMFPELFD